MRKLSYNERVIHARGIVKKFGFKTVLRKIDLSLNRGDFLALFGPNGAGKTTFIQILCSLMRPTSGEVCVLGYDTRYDREALCRTIGVVSHNPFLYDNLTALENLKFFGKMYEVPELEDRVEELLVSVGLIEYINDPVQTFSRGMRQRLSVARAIIHDPAILFLDEPYTGLDPHGMEDLKQILKRFHGQGKTIIMTSHDLPKGLELCNQAAILKSGTLIYLGDISTINRDEFIGTYLTLTGRKRSPII